MKFYNTILLVLFLIFLSVSCTDTALSPYDEADEEMNVIHVESILLGDDLMLTVGQTSELIPSIVPGNATDKSVNWLSTNSESVTVDNSGLINAVKVGVSSIVAYTTDGSYSDSIVVAVSDSVTVTGISLGSDIVIRAGKSEQLVPIVTPINATVKNLVWGSSDENIAVVSVSGLVTAGTTAGSAIITAAAPDGSYSDMIEVTVNTDIEVKGMYLTNDIGDTITSAKAAVGDSISLIPEFYPDYATNLNVTFQFSDETKADCEFFDNELTVTALGAGIITMTVCSNDSPEITDSVELIFYDPGDLQSPEVMNLYATDDRTLRIDFTELMLPYEFNTHDWNISKFGPAGSMGDPLAITSITDISDSENDYTSFQITTIERFEEGFMYGVEVPTGGRGQGLLDLAGVAVGTLYRYFLYTSELSNNIDADMIIEDNGKISIAPGATTFLSGGNFVPGECQYFAVPKQQYFVDESDDALAYSEIGTAGDSVTTTAPDTTCVLMDFQDDSPDYIFANGEYDMFTRYRWDIDGNFETTEDHALIYGNRATFTVTNSSL